MYNRRRMGQLFSLDKAYSTVRTLRPLRLRPALLCVDAPAASGALTLHVRLTPSMACAAPHRAYLAGPASPEFRVVDLRLCAAKVRAWLSCRDEFSSLGLRLKHHLKHEFI